MLITLSYLAITLLCFAGVWAFRRWGVGDALLEHPNSRSSHSVPTPSGGGLIIVLASLTGLNLFAYNFSGNFLLLFTIGALLITCVSLVDDLMTVKPIIRISVHGIAAALAIFEFGPLLKIELPVFGVFDFGYAGYVLTFLWIVWLINAYNFMDGIDGLAGLQAVISGAGLAAVGYFFAVPEVITFGCVLSSASLGFLFHNWQPARIFMGDVGSAFLGYSFAVMPLCLLGRIGVFDARIPIMAAVLVWLFVFDSVLTLVYRMLTRERFWQAHRQHIYQRLVIAGMPHAAVTVAYGVGAILTNASLLLALYYRNYFLRIISLTLLLDTAMLFLLWVFRSRIASSRFSEVFSKRVARA